MFEHPSQALAGCRIQSEGIVGDPLDVQPRSCRLEGVKHLGEAAAVLRHAESIDQRPLEIGDRHPGISDPHLLRTEEAGRPHLDEPVDDVVDEAVARLFRAASPQARDGCLMSRKHEGRPWHLRREAVVVQRGPVRDGSGIDQCHGDLELVHRRHTRYGRSQRVESPTKRDDPTALPEVVQRLSKVGGLHARPGRQFPRSVDREDTIPLVREQAYQLDSDQRPLGLRYRGHGLLSRGCPRFRSANLMADTVS